MTKVNIKCCQPTIINNPAILKIALNIRYLHFLDYHIPVNYTLDNYKTIMRKLSHNRCLCDYDNINQFYAIDIYGEIYPLYILVKCNKCMLCQDNKIQQWQFRAIAEKNISKNNTYMVTLTYNDKYLPKHGVDVRAVQLFMKRLRNNLDKKNIEHNIKYIATGEYGKNTQRPHYHIILFHFPDDKFKNLHDILTFIEHSWSVYNPYTQKHTPIGFAYCTPTHEHSIKYALKYLFKQPNIPYNCRSNFHTSSRGIGLQYLIDNFQYLKNNPALISLSINDYQYNTLFTTPYPEYYKYRLMKTKSLIFPKVVIDTFERLLLLHTQLQTLSLIKEVNYSINPILYKYYDILFEHPEGQHPLTSTYIDSYFYTYYNTFYNQQLEDKYHLILHNYNTLCDLLEMYYKKYKQLYFDTQSFKNQRTLHLQSLPEKDYILKELEAINENKLYKQKKSSYNELF